MTYDGNELAIRLDARGLTFPIVLDPIIETVAWELKDAALPEARFSHAAARLANGNVLMFGGMTTTGPLDDTWTWNGNAWQRFWPPSASDEYPSARAGHGIAWDAARTEAVMFGGIGEGGPISDGTTWLWTGSAWAVASATGDPPEPRAHHAMAFDHARGVVVLFGGTGDAGDLADIWEWDGTSWERREPQGLPGSPAPAARHGHVMASEVGGAGIYVFGGRTATGLSDETWHWDGAQWTLLEGPRPPARSGAGMAYDHVRHVITLFGGEGVAGALNDAWSLQGGSWVSLDVDFDRPPARSGVVLVSDKRGLAAMGGRRGGSARDDVWRLSSSLQWSDVTPNPPPARAMGAGAYHDVERKVFVFGGSVDGAPVGDTWSWDGTRWQEWTHVIAPPARFQHAMAYDARRERLVLFGGASAGDTVFEDVWEWGRPAPLADPQWSDVTPPSTADGPGPRYGHAMAYDPTRGRVVLVGGSNASGPQGDSWAWDGMQWRSMSGTVPIRSAHAMAYHPERNALVLFGGEDGTHPLQDAYELQGDNWVQIHVSGDSQPDARFGHSMVGDDARGVVVMFGGISESGQRPSTWELAWDAGGYAWKEALEATEDPDSSPGPRDYSAMAFDSARRRVVLFGGRGPDALAETWEYHAWGNACSSNAECSTGYCADGVCCESACGGGSTTDCQACSRAAGGTQDGTCTPVRPDHPEPCRGAEGVCDVAEYCNGTSTTCPQDGFKRRGTECAPAGFLQPCDAPDECDGLGTCVRTYKAEGTECRRADGDCDVADTCDDHGTCRPQYVLAGTPCRDTEGDCDAPEACTGSSPTCPEDIPRPAGTPCGDYHGQECDLQDRCDGVSKSCEDRVRPHLWTCGNSQMAWCDEREHCDGTAKDCPAEEQPWGLDPGGRLACPLPPVDMRPKFIVAYDDVATEYAFDYAARKNRVLIVAVAVNPYSNANVIPLEHPSVTIWDDIQDGQWIRDGAGSRPLPSGVALTHVVWSKAFNADRAGKVHVKIDGVRTGMKFGKAIAAIEAVGVKASGPVVPDRLMSADTATGESDIAGPAEVTTSGLQEHVVLAFATSVGSAEVDTADTWSSTLASLGGAASPNGTVFLSVAASPRSLVEDAVEAGRRYSRARSFVVSAAAYKVAPTKIVLDGSLGTFSVGGCVPVTLSLRNDTGVPVPPTGPVAFEVAASPSATFHGDPACTGSGQPTALLPFDMSQHTRTVFMRDGAAGAHVLSATKLVSQSGSGTEDIEALSLPYMVRGNGAVKLAIALPGQWPPPVLGNPDEVSLKQPLVVTVYAVDENDRVDAAYGPVTVPLTVASSSPSGQYPAVLSFNAGVASLAVTLDGEETQTRLTLTAGAHGAYPALSGTSSAFNVRDTTGSSITTNSPGGASHDGEVEIVLVNESGRPIHEVVFGAPQHAVDASGTTFVRGDFLWSFNPAPQPECDGGVVMSNTVSDYYAKVFSGGPLENNARCTFRLNLAYRFPSASDVLTFTDLSASWTTADDVTRTRNDIPYVVKVVKDVLHPVAIRSVGLPGTRFIWNNIAERPARVIVVKGTDQPADKVSYVVGETFGTGPSTVMCLRAGPTSDSSACSDQETPKSAETTYRIYNQDQDGIYSTGNPGDDLTVPGIGDGVHVDETGTFVVAVQVTSLITGAGTPLGGPAAGYVAYPSNDKGLYFFSTNGDEHRRATRLAHPVLRPVALPQTSALPPYEHVFAASDQQVPATAPAHAYRINVRADHTTYNAEGCTGSGCPLAVEMDARAVSGMTMLRSSAAPASVTAQYPEDTFFHATTTGIVALDVNLQEVWHKPLASQSFAEALIDHETGRAWFPSGSRGILVLDLAGSRGAQEPSPPMPWGTDGWVINTKFDTPCIKSGAAVFCGAITARVFAVETASGYHPNCSFGVSGSVQGLAPDGAGGVVYTTRSGRLGRRTLDESKCDTSPESAFGVLVGFPDRALTTFPLSPPLIHEGMIYVGYRGAIRRFDLETGLQVGASVVLASDGAISGLTLTQGAGGPVIFAATAEGTYWGVPLGAFR
ncbi:MAG: hypothetical protein AB2A00_25060 [Myxococcota bacterium]